MSSDFIKWVEKIFRLVCKISESNHELHDLSFVAYAPQLYTVHKLVSETWNKVSLDGWSWFKSLSVNEVESVRIHGETIHVSNLGVLWEVFDRKLGTQFTSDWIPLEDLRSCISPVQMLIENARG